MRKNRGRGLEAREWEGRGDRRGGRMRKNRGREGGRKKEREGGREESTIVQFQL